MLAKGYTEILIFKYNLTFVVFNLFSIGLNSRIA